MTTVSNSKLGIILSIIVVIGALSLIEYISNNHPITKGEIKFIALSKPDPIRQSSIKSDETVFTPRTGMSLVSIGGYICSDQPNTNVTLTFPLMPTHESVGFRQVNEPITIQLTTHTEDGWFCEPFGGTTPITKLYTTETYYVSVIAMPSKITKLKFSGLGISVNDFGESIT